MPNFSFFSSLFHQTCRDNAVVGEGIDTKDLVGIREIDNVYRVVDYLKDSRVLTRSMSYGFASYAAWRRDPAVREEAVDCA